MNDDRREINYLKWQLCVVENENARLRKQLNKKTAPPKGTPVRDMLTGQVFYSAGILGNNLSLHVTNTKTSTFCSELQEWEEIEIKLK